jgi:hypothetical protein
MKIMSMEHKKLVVTGEQTDGRTLTERKGTDGRIAQETRNATSYETLIDKYQATSYEMLQKH